MKQSHRRYTTEEAAFLRNNRPGHTEPELLELFNARFTPPLTLNQVAAYCGNHKLRSGLDRRFGHGQVKYAPPKGKRSSPATEFKKGNRPQTWRPVGSECLRDDGYVWIKVAEPRYWRQKHVLVWESLHGPRPSKHAVVFADGNRLNFDPDNLVLLSRQELVRMNQCHLLGSSRELTELGRLVVAVRTKTRTRRLQQHNT